jgi:hypothetical protein
LVVNNSLIADNGNGATGGGIVIKPGAAGGGKVSMTNVRIVNNANNGLMVDGTGSSGTGIFVSIENSLVAFNANGIQALHPVGGQAILITGNGLQIVNNSGTGILGNGGAATMRIGNSTIAGNGTGVSRLNASNVTSYGDNRLDGNVSADGTFFVPNINKE